MTKPFGLVLGPSSGSFANQLHEMGRSLDLSGFQFPVYKMKVILPVTLACQGCCHAQVMEQHVSCTAPSAHSETAQRTHAHVRLLAGRKLGSGTFVDAVTCHTALFASLLSLIF